MNGICRQCKEEVGHGNAEGINLREGKESKGDGYGGGCGDDGVIPAIEKREAGESVYESYLPRVL